MDLISIIIPVYNTELYIRECIDSIMEQSYQNFELILVDDGSSDLSGKICDEYADRDNRVKVIHQKNSGVSNARNTGVLSSKGKWVMFVDSDDKIDKNLLMKVSEYFEKEYDLIFFSYEEMYVNSVVKKEVTDYRYKVNNYELDQIMLKILNKNYKVKDYIDRIKVSVPWGKMIKRELITSNKLSFIPALYGEDMVYNLYCFQYAKQAIFLDESLYCYRQRKKSLFNGYRDKISAQLEEQFIFMREFVEVFKTDDKFIEALLARKLINNMYTVIKDVCNVGNPKKWKVRKKDFMELEMDLSNYELKNIASFPIKEKILLFLIKKKMFMFINLLTKSQYYLEKTNIKKRKFD